MGKTVGWVLFIAIALLLFLSLNKSSAQYATISLDEFATRLMQDRVGVVTIEGDRLIGKFRTDETVGDMPERVHLFQVVLPPGSGQDWRMTQWLLENRQNATIRADANPNWLLQVIIPLIPWLLIFAFIWFFVFRGMRRLTTTDPNAPRPVYLVPPPTGVAPTQQQQPPSTPAPGGDN